MTVRPNIKSVNIVNRTKANAVALQKAFSKVCPSIRFNVVDVKVVTVTESEQKDKDTKGTESTEEKKRSRPKSVTKWQYDAECVQQADIICTTTSSNSPLFDGRWCKDNVHINCVGSYKFCENARFGTYISLCDVTACVCLFLFVGEQAHNARD